MWSELTSAEAVTTYVLLGVSDLFPCSLNQILIKHLPYSVLTAPKDQSYPDSSRLAWIVLPHYTAQHYLGLLILRDFLPVSGKDGEGERNADCYRQREEQDRR